MQGNLIEDNYEYLARIATYKLSNRELLGFLVSAGVIPSIYGWSLKAIYLNGPGSIYAISGTIDDIVSDGSGGFDDFQSIVEGSWLFAAGRPINNLSDFYPEAEPFAP